MDSQGLDGSKINFQPCSFDGEPLSRYVADEIGQYVSPAQILQKFNSTPWQVTRWADMFDRFTAERRAQLAKARKEIAFNNGNAWRSGDTRDAAGFFDFHTEGVDDSDHGTPQS